MKNNKNKIQPLNPTLHRLRATLPDKNIQKVFIQDFLKLKVKELHPITETTDKWDMDLIQKHYYTIAKSLVTLDDNHKIIVRIAYFSRDDLLKDWEADIITTGTELLWKSLSLSDEELKSELLDLGARYLYSCADSKTYGSTLFGMIPMKDRQVAMKIYLDIKKISVDVPSKYGLSDIALPLKEALEASFASLIENGADILNLS
jgi:hypothetical protein